MLVRKLPVEFAAPVILSYDAGGNIILGPVSHDTTVNMAVSPIDATVVAVTGWPDVVENKGRETVWLTRNAGETWADITGDLAEATASIGMFRPSGLLLLPLSAATTTGTTVAVLIGTVSGVFVSFDAITQGVVTPTWSRLGSCADLPLVLAKGLSHEPLSDTLLVATFGRGVYRLANATAALGRVFQQKRAGAC